MKLKQTGPLVMVLVFCAFSTLAAEAELSEVRRELKRDIEKAQKELSATEADISKEREELSRRINRAQNRVLDLRQKSVAARRAADEETLSLSKIENRLKVWQEQSEYQSRLLTGFLDRSGRRSLGDIVEFNLEEDLQLLNQLLAEQQARLYPGWRQESIVSPDGQIEDGDVLNLGPIHLFMRAERQQSGLINREHHMNRVSMLFDRETHAGIADLYRDANGSITFDPTLSRALLLAEDQETILEHLQKGGIWIIPILLFALFASITAVCKAVSLFRMPPLFPALAERVAAAMKDNTAALKSIMEKVHGPQKELLQIALTPQTAEQRDDRLHAALLTHRNRLERWLGAIAMTASVSPLLGLLGTVSGMIATFKLMTLFGAGDPSSVSAGISEALVTTEMGLIVAIPALLAHALMSRKVRNIYSQLEGDAVLLSQLPLRESRP
ncbi:MAG: MotA/TolQ/ExbB proton channel family protein [Deltaproteobacteria bacterium]|nr:MotA/TolQ/ExbB proton channel family protein [Deltaproteobacteria bacterium]